MKSLMKFAIAGVMAVSAALSATGAAALPFLLEGTFSITAVNYNPTGDNNQRSTRSQATAVNFDNLTTGSKSFGDNILSDTFTYTGPLDFRAARDVTPNPMTIGDWLKTATGNLNGFTDLDSTFAARTLSAGEGGSDGVLDGKFLTTTLFKITASSLNIGNLADLFNVKHDDGVTFTDANGNSVASVGPNTELTTDLFNKLQGGASDFTLIYAAANGNPSVLEVQAVPLPAAAWLLLAVSGGLIAAKRRSARQAA